MDTAGIFHTAESGYTDLWEVTWERIDIFLPNLKQELFRGEQKKTISVGSKPTFSETQQPQHLMPPAVAQLPENERMGQPAMLPPSVTSANVLALNPAAYNSNKTGVTVGISSNPLYAQADIAPAVEQAQQAAVIPTTAQVDIQTVSDQNGF